MSSDSSTCDIAWLHAVLDVPPEHLAVAAGFWGRALDWRAGAGWPGHPELRSFEPPQGNPYLHLQEIDGPVRVHLDLESVDVAATVDRVVEAGGTTVADRGRWQTFRSPGGLPFCIFEATELVPPEPTQWPDGHRSRMVQVCIDSPRGLHESEVRFWRSVLGDRWVDSPAPEFAGKWHNDAGSPLQLLFQRLDDTGGSVRAHLDHGTNDVAAEVGRLSRLGARDVAAGRGWQLLHDPLGLAFCVTENSPELVQHRDLS